MKELIYQRCYNHQHREAVARCPECGLFFCRECVTEHEDRVLCTDCLKHHTASSLSAARHHFGGLIRIFQLLLGGVLLWMFFYYLGQVLFSLPTAFHEGTLWETPWWENQ